MRVLGIHTERFRFTCREKATAGAEAVPPARGESELHGPCMVVFVAVEKGDAASPASVAAQLAADIQRRLKDLQIGTVVLYPYVHLTEEPSTARVALRALKETEQRVGEFAEVLRAPFGWYKAFEIACLGHPLAEWSGRYSPQAGAPSASAEPAPARKPSEFTRFVVADLEGNTFDVTTDDFATCPAFRNPQHVYGLLRQFVSNELAAGVVTDAAPKHIAYMRRHELVDYCEVSEKGHYKWYPKGLLMQKLIVDYAAQIAREWGAVEMRNPIVIRGDHNLVGQLMGEFHERDYQVDGGRGVCYLRYASDPCAFPFMQNVRFSHRQSPLKVYEEATCFRNEREGEVSGLKRVRSFTMTDMHAACADEAEARREFEALCLRFARLMDDIIAPGRWVLGWEGTTDFFEQNRRWLVGIGGEMGVPAFFKLMPRMSHYFAMKNEFQSITEDLSNIQISTVQWDVKDGKRFDIGYVDEDGCKHPSPVIIHASSFGSIERALCAILENIALDARDGAPPAFPLWLAPTQVRVVPVSESHLPFATGVCERLSREDIRADVDDRNETVGKKVRNGEREWVPYLLVVGDREASSATLAVRRRESGDTVEMPLAGLVEEVRHRTAGMPFRPLPLPTLLSRRPIFFG